MIVTTTGAIEGHEIDGYLGVVSGRATTRVKVVRSIVAELRDRLGGRIVAGTYRSDRPDPYQVEFAEARQNAIADLERVAAATDADAVVGVQVDSRTEAGGTMMIVTASGTAVRVKRAAQAGEMRA